LAAEIVPAILVLDSWPVLEWIKGRQPTAAQFTKLVDASEAGDISFEMSRINYGEILYSLQKPDAKDVCEQGLIDLATLRIFRHSVDDALVDEAVELKSKYPFSYADAFAAALAIRLQSPLLTGDREFVALERDGLLRVQWIGA
jgi:predicted nucleic acid-binding protein